MNERFYEVWLLGDQPEEGQLVARFRRFDDARRYCQEHVADGRHDVKMPDGRWYGSHKTEPVIDPDAFSDKR